MNYEDLNFKIPIESPTYRQDSEFLIMQIVDFNAYDLKFISDEDIKYILF